MRKRILLLLTNTASFLLGAGGVIINNQLKERKKAILPKESNSELAKWKEFYWLFNKWLLLKQQEQSLESYFESKGYRTIAIYGLKELGLRLIDELKGSSVSVAYAIDKNAKSMKRGITMYTPQEDLPEVDAIIVTAIHYFEEIKEDLNMVCPYPIISLKEIIESAG